jgi:hypothetical protein
MAALVFQIETIAMGAATPFCRLLFDIVNKFYHGAEIEDAAQ